MAKAESKRPTRDEYVLEEIGNQIVEAKNEGNEVILSVWGKIEPIRGEIIVLDSRTRLVHIEKNGEVTKVPFMDIMKVGNAI